MDSDRRPAAPSSGDRGGGAGAKPAQGLDEVAGAAEPEPPGPVGGAGQERARANGSAPTSGRSSSKRERKVRLPDKRGQNLTQRTSDDMRKPADTESADVQEQISRQLLMLLQGLQGGAVPGAAAPAEPDQRPVRKVPPPLGQAAGVIPSEAVRRSELLPGESAEEAARRANKKLPFKDRDGAPLPELVSLESIELDSEIAEEWGEQAVIRSGRLRWLAWLVYLALAGGGLYVIYDSFLRPENPEPLREASKAAADAALREEQVLYECRQTLSGFLLATNNSGRAAFVRQGVTALPLMADHESRAQPLPTAVESLSLRDQRAIDGHDFVFVDGVFSEGSRFSAVFEKTESKYLLDWRSFVGYSEADLRAFVEAKPLATTARPPLFRLEVRAGPPGQQRPFNTADDYRAFEFLLPGTTFRCEAYARSGSPEDRGLARLVGLAGDSVKVMVRLKYLSGEEGNRVLVVDELVGESWLQP